MTREMLKGSLALLAMLYTASAPAIGAHLYAVNAEWQAADIIEYDSDGNFVRTFSSKLPTGYRLDALGELRWGTNGHLYSYGALDDGNPDNGTDWQNGVFEWKANGQFVSFTPNTSGYGDISGFDVLGNGNFVGVGLIDPDGTKVKEFDGLFSNPTIYTGVAGFEGDQGAIHVGNSVYVVGASCLTKYDSATDSFVSGVGTLRDNALIDVSSKGLLALNDQWTGGSIGDDIAQIEIYDLDMALKATVLMPQQYMTTRGLAFGDDGYLYVASMLGTVNATGDGFDSWSPMLVVYDNNFAYVGMYNMTNLREAGDITFGQAVPGPASGLAMLIGWIPILRRRRHR